MLALGGGDEAAFDVLFSRWGGRLLGYLQRMVSEPSIAEELVQEAFLRVYRARESYKAEGMERGSWWSVAIQDLLMNPVESLKNVAKADLKAAALPSSDPLQLGGVTIVDASGILRYRHLATKPTDIPSNRKIFDALDALA